jgi:hypothetical protein
MFFAKQASRHIKKAHSKNIAYLWNILSNGTSQKVGFCLSSILPLSGLFELE